jgi:hypothetical protein
MMTYSPTGKATQASAQILIDAWVTGEEIEALANGIDEPVGYVDTATFFRNVIPDIVEIAFRFRCDTMRHLV